MCVFVYVWFTNLLMKKLALYGEQGAWPITHCSIVGVSDNPTVELYPAGRAGENHTLTEERLTGLIVEDNDHEEREGWASEMGEGNLTSSKTTVEWEPWE